MAGNGHAEQVAFPRVLILGPIAIETPDGLVTLRGQQAAVLGLLAAAAPRAVAIDALADQLWPHGAPASARTGLAVVIHRLRQRLGADTEVIVNEGESYRLAIPITNVDHGHFTNLVAEAAEHRTTDPHHAISLVEKALALWRGRAFQHLELRDSIQSMANALDGTQSDVQELLAELLLAVDRPQDAALWVTQLVDEDPYRERRWELLILALYRCGRQAEALRAAQDARQRLRDDLGITIGPTLAQLEHDVLTQAPTLDLAAGPGASGTSQPVPTQLGDSADRARNDAFDGAAFLPPQSAGWDLPPSTDGPFVGRVDLEDTIDAMLRSARLVTITGPMGAGKSRLAARHVATLTDHRSCWFDAHDTGADELTERLRAMFQVRPLDDELAALVNTLGTAPTVLVIDNADLITDAVAELSERLLEKCPTLRIMITSRRPLGSPSERLLPVPPLLPRHGVELLLSLTPLMAHAAIGDEGLRHEALAELAAYADGLPLCIELLAPALAHLTPDQVRADIDQIMRSATRTGAPDNRHVSLDAAYTWSLRRLSDEVQQLFAQLSVFRGSFAVEDVAALTGRSVDRARDQLEVLRTHRLVELDHVVPRARFRLLNSARLHAKHQLAADEATDAHRRHAEHHVALLSSLGPRLCDQDEPAAVKRLQEVDTELTSTLRWLTAAGTDPERAITFAIALWEHDFLRQRFNRYSWIEQILDSHPTAPEIDIFPSALGSAALSAWAQNRFEAALTLASRAETAAKDRGQAVPMAAIKARFNTAVHLGQMEQGLRLLPQLLAASKDQADPRHHADTLVIVTMGQAQLGMPEALETANAALDLVLDTGNPSSISWSQVAVGTAQMLTDKRAAARTHNAAARSARTVSNVFVEGMALTGLVTALRHLGRSAQVQPVLLGVLDLWWRAQAIPQVHRCASEAALLLLDRGDRTGAARVLAALDLVDRAHPILAEDQARIDQAMTTLDLDQPFDIDPTDGAPDPTQLLVRSIRQALLPRS